MDRRLTAGPRSLDLLIEYPIRYDDEALLDPEPMGSGIDSGGVVCRDDNQCTFFPSPQGGVGTNLADFTGELIQGDWWVCVGDGAGADQGVLDGMRIEVLPK